MKIKRGFLLAELVISLAIISTGIVYILQAISLSAQVNGLSNDLTKAVFLLEDEITKLEIKEKFSLTEEETGKSNSQNKFLVSLKQEDLGQNQLFRLDSKAEWKRANRYNDLILSLVVKNAH